MSRFKILVVSAAPTTATRLAERLDRADYDISAATPGPGLIRALRHARPQLAVLDGIDARPDAAQLEVALLKDQCPGVQIIALSAESTETDGAVIEQGVFCYLGGGSFEQLLRVIEAARSERHEAADHNRVHSTQLRSNT